MDKGWIVADHDFNTKKVNFLYLVGKYLWGKDPWKCKIFASQQEAEKVALKMDSNAWEVTMRKDSYFPFIVTEW